MRNRKLWVGTVALTVLGFGALAIYQYVTHRAGHLLARGRAALNRGDATQLKAAEEALEHGGHLAALRLLRGEARVRAANAAQTPEAPARPLARLPVVGDWLLAGATPWPTAVVGLAARLAVGVPPPVAPGRDAVAGQLRLALSELTRVRDDGATGAEATVLAAECLVRLGERRLAAEALKQVVIRQPDLVVAHRWLAAIYIDLNSPEEAIEHLTAWGRLDPTDCRPFRWVGFFRRDYGRPADAAEAYREALRRRLEPGVRKEVIGELAAVLADSLKQYREALAVLDAGAEVLGDDPAARTLGAECLWLDGREDDAVARVAAVLDGHPEHAAALLLRARIHLARDEAAAAVPLLRRTLVGDPYNVAAHKLLLDAAQGTGGLDAMQQKQQLDEARQLMGRLSELQQSAVRQPWNDGIRCEIAELCFQIRRPAAAQTWLRAALAINPDNPRAKRLLAAEFLAP